MEKYFEDRSNTGSEEILTTIFERSDKATSISWVKGGGCNSDMLETKKSVYTDQHQEEIEYQSKK